MQRRVLGKTGMEASVLGFGGAEFGFEGVTEAVAVELLNSALDAGLNIIDTASAYLESEKLIGKAIATRRKDLLLFTKCGATDGFAKSDWSKSGIMAQVEQSLRNLRTDHVDLLQLHSCSGAEIQAGEVIDALQTARAKGYARFIGYSGDGRDAVAAVNSMAFDTLQTSINIADQEALRLTLPLARAQNLGVIAKRPVANAAWKTGVAPTNEYHKAYWDRLQLLDYEFLKSDVSTSVAKALSFTLAQDGVHTAIVGTTRPGRWQENARMLTAVSLSQADLNGIRTRWDEVAKSDWTGQV